MIWANTNLLNVNVLYIIDHCPVCFPCVLFIFVTLNKYVLFIFVPNYPKQGDN